MCSSWYYYRYLDPSNDEAFASPEALKKWMPVDFYLGGEEHVNGHLLYSRFFTKVLFDAGYIDFDEPFAKHRHQGLILGPDHRKMSKRWDNVVNPTDVVNEYGADTLRMYEMFMGPLEQTKPWDTNGVKGIYRFLEKVWKLQDKVESEKYKDDAQMSTLVHRTIKKVTEDLEELKFNTAIAKLMELVNEMQKEKYISKEGFEIFLKLLAPFAPHIAEELWQRFGNTTSITTEPWPTFDPAKTVEDTVTLAVQVNGKVRATVEASSDISEEDAKALALKQENVQKWLEGKEPKKMIYIKGKLVSIVV
jgi:leucyl-tRNA synthetase